MAKQGFRKLATVDEAFRAIEGITRPVGSERVSLDAALGRILAEDVVAAIDVPHFAKSSMDGYAVRAEDVVGASAEAPKLLRVMGSLTPGDMTDEVVAAGTCFEIATGAPVPGGADGVVMVEHTERDGDEVAIYRPVAKGHNVISVGSDVREGATVLRRGMRLGPRHTGVIAAIGLDEVVVARRPSVAVVSNGDELLPLGAPLQPGKVYDINRRTLVDALTRAGVQAEDRGIVPDDPDAMAEILAAEAASHDLVIISGGSSLGEGDHMEAVITSLGEVYVHGVAVKPGKPMLVGRIGETPFIGLPGHPASALTDCLYFVIPMVRAMMGAEATRAETREARLGRKVFSTIGRMELMSVRLVDDADGLVAEPILRGSSAITTLTDGDGYVTIDVNVEVLAKGTAVSVTLFE